MSQEPLFWYRPRSDGGYEGPLHNGQIEDVRKASGAWVPLFAGAAPVSAEPVAVPECPFHCGWDGLHKIAVQDAAYLARLQWLGDEEGVSVPRVIVMSSMDYLIQVCRTMLNAAPVAAQPDITQQTLDDVMAGIPARDAEIEALRKEIETLQAAQAQPVRSTAMAEAKHPFRLAMSPLTRTIFAGRIRQRDGYAEAVGIRHDVTADFYECLIRMAESHDGEFTITANGEPAYDVIVRARKEQT